jgi:hypothetical protein
MVLRFLRKRSWDIHDVAPPWGDRPSIHRALSERLAAAPDAPVDIELPDEARVVDESGLRWAAGAMDGTFAHHGGRGRQDALADAALRALRALADHATDANAAAMYAVLLREPALGYVDALAPAVVADAGRAERLLAIGRWLATTAADREPVKAAIAMIGALSPGGDRDLLLTLGRHEELTLFSAVALQATESAAASGPEPLLWQLARGVHGWGRVHLVERLAGTSDPAIKAWLLRDGCRNAIMDEYTALICARTGDLLAALRRAAPDAALLRGAGTILTALMRGGPAEGIEGYPEGPQATRLLLRHLRGRAGDLESLTVVAAIDVFLRERVPNDAALAAWRSDAPRLEADVREIKADPAWPARIAAGLGCEDRLEFARAAAVAGWFGMDTWDIHFDRLQRGGDEWHAVARTADPARIDRVVAFAEARLPLERLASGPEAGLDLGPAFAEHTALELVLQELARFPGRGWTLLRTALRSQVTRTRNMAVRALAAWGRERWPPDAELALRHALKAELNADTRDEMRGLLEA